MKKQITIITLAIIMLTAVTAMYAGDTMSFETNITEPAYIVVNNSYDLEGLNITFKDGNITISPALNYKPDNFTLIFFDNATKEVIKTIRTHSHRRGRTEYVYENVTVTEEVEVVVTEKVIVKPECDTCNDTVVVNTIVEEDNFWRNTAWMLGGIVLLYIIYKFMSLFRYGEDLVE